MYPFLLSFSCNIVHEEATNLSLDTDALEPASVPFCLFSHSYIIWGRLAVAAVLYRSTLHVTMSLWEQPQPFPSVTNGGYFYKNDLKQFVTVWVRDWRSSFLCGKWSMSAWEEPYVQSLIVRMMSLSRLIPHEFVVVTWEKGMAFWSIWEHVMCGDDSIWIQV